MPDAPDRTDRTDRSPRPRDGGRRSWHRRASRPVSLWMVTLVVVVLIHPILPQSRWLMVHMVTLGLVATSVMVWGQHFAEALLKTRLAEETRPRQVIRSYLLTAGVVITIAGMLPSWPWLVVAGSLLVSAAMLWYALALGAQVRAALAPRFTFTVRAYIGAACLLPLGAALGAVMAFSPGEPWQGRLLLAHQVLNILGFVGITVTGTLLTLWPTILRTKADPAATRRSAWGLLGMGLGVVAATTGALLAWVPLGVSAVLVYMVSFGWVAITLLRVAVRSAQQPHRIELPWFPILSVAAGMVWFVLGLGGLTAVWWASADEHLSSSLVAADAQSLTVPFVAGFLLQVLLGAMSYLLPVTMGGGPRAVRAALAQMSRFAAVRAAVYNLVVALFVLASVEARWSGAVFSGLTIGTTEVSEFGSWARVLTSLLAFAALLGFMVLMGLAVRASIRERLPQGQGPVPVSLESPGTAGAPGATGPVGTTRASGAHRPDGAQGVSSPAGQGSNPPAQPGLDRRALTGALLGAGSVLGVTAVGAALDRAAGGAASGGVAGAGGEAAGAGSAVSPTGETTTIAVSAIHMRFHPDVLEVPAGNSLVIEVTNDDPQEVHDLVLADGTASGRLQPGASATMDVGVITQDTEGWCSIVGHRAMGMTLQIVAEGAAAPTEQTPPSGDSTGVDELTRVPLDLTAEPAADYAVRDAVLPPSAGPEQRLTLEVQEAAIEVAPGVRMDAMTFNGTVTGPIIRSELGAKLTVDLVNNGSMGHSLDMHAGRVAPDNAMRTIAPGESLEYAITTDYAGAWLYHCGTMPMTVHLAAGMLGVLIVPPQDLARADREYVLVQSDHYLVPQDAPGFDEAMHAGAHPVSPAKIAAERPDITMFNGHANQYVHAPLEARVGERVRIWVMAAGPDRGISFHVVGAIFDTVFFEGDYQLRPDNETGGGSQALHLGAAQGGFVEMVFEEPGTYTAVNHAFADMERGARALIKVTE